MRLAGARLPAQITHAAQVALAFFADIGDENQIAKVVDQIGERLNRFSDGQQRRQSRAVIGHAWTMQSPIRSQVDLFVFARRKHGVEVRRQRDIRPSTILPGMRDDVTAPIDPRDAS